MEHKENHSDPLYNILIIRFKQRVHRHILRLIIYSKFIQYSHTIREVPLYHALVRRHNGKWDIMGTREERETYILLGTSNVRMFARLFLFNRIESVLLFYFILIAHKHLRRIVYCRRNLKA